MFMNTSKKDKVFNTMSGLFYCEITDHLPCFLSLKFEKYNWTDERPMTRIFGEQNCATFIQNMQSQNCNEIYNEHDVFYRFHPYLSILKYAYTIYRM